MKYLLICLPLLLTFSCRTIQPPERVLIFSATGKRDNGKAGYRHKCIEHGVECFKKLNSAELLFDFSEDPGLFNEKSLSSYKAVVFFNTTRNIFNDTQKRAFENYIRNGGGFAGIHAASTTEYNWPWFGQLCGARFSSHPKVQKARLNIINNSHPSTRHLGKEWQHTDEWYNFTVVEQGLNFLITVDENSYKGGTHGNPHPLAWYREFDGGRSFYTALGHTHACYDNPLFIKHVIGGILWACGRN